MSKGATGSLRQRKSQANPTVTQLGKLKLPTERDFDAKLHISRDSAGRETVRVKAPGTPWDEIDLSSTFLAHPAAPAKRSFFSSRRFVLLIGGLIGVLFTWAATTTPDGMIPELLDRHLSNLGLEMPTSFSDLALMRSLSLNISMPDVFQPTRAWLQGRDFQVGRETLAEGHEKKHAVLLVPGIISSGLESWTTSEDHAQFFRQRIWGTVSMMRAIVTRKKEWIRAMSLDEDTGLDLPGVKVRSAQGLDAASYFVTGYWIWSKVIENLAVLNYDHNDLHLAAYDWRLSYGNLQVRDKYFSQLKYHIEHNLRVMGKKTVIVSHSMGALVVIYFFKWAESPEHGGGGDQWVEQHIASFVNVAGTVLGVPKAMAALLSGEMRDTVELNPAGVYLLERFFSRQERAKLFRSWAGAASMWLKGGNDVWGDEYSAPDDPEDATHSSGYIYRFRNADNASSRAPQPNLTMNGATEYLMSSTSSAYQRMLASNWSFGIERDPERIAANDADPRRWTNPLETRLPNAPSMQIYCVYGHGKPTERGYIYAHEGYEQGHEMADTSSGGRNSGGHEANVEGGDPVCDADDLECNQQTRLSALSLPLKNIVYVDNSVHDEAARPQVRSGVVMGEGDGTVSLLSLGAMCVDGWKRDLYNPGRSPVTTVEIKHDPVPYDPRGGPSTADHIDVLGNDQLNRAIALIACGRGDLVKENIISRIKEYSAKIRWSGKEAQTGSSAP